MHSFTLCHFLSYPKDIKYHLSKDSIILLEQVRTIDKQRLKEKMGSLDGVEMNMVNLEITETAANNSPKMLLKNMQKWE